MKTRYNSRFFGLHFICLFFYYYAYFQLSTPYSCIFTSLFFSMLTWIDIILNYIYKSYRNLKYSKILYDSLVFWVESILLYTKWAHKTIPGEFLILFLDDRLCDCHQRRIRLLRTKEKRLHLDSFRWCIILQMWHKYLALQQIRNFDLSEIIPLKRALAVTINNFIGNSWLLLHPHSVQSVHEVITFYFIHKHIDVLCPFSSSSNCISKQSGTDITLYFRSGSRGVIMDSGNKGPVLSSSCSSVPTYLSPSLCAVV
jgi:hypothetical protein